MGQRLAALVAALVVGFGFSLPARAADQSEVERTSRKALAFFEGHSDETIDAFLMRLQPDPSNTWYCSAVYWFGWSCYQGSGSKPHRARRRRPRWR